MPKGAGTHWQLTEAQIRKWLDDYQNKRGPYSDGVGGLAAHVTYQFSKWLRAGHKSQIQAQGLAAGLNPHKAGCYCLPAP